MRKSNSNYRLLVLLISITSLSSCAQWGAEPWERGTLAKQEMQPVASSIDAAFDDHIYFSKEASSGGASFGGGGCGCN